MLTRCLHHPRPSRALRYSTLLILLALLAGGARLTQAQDSTPEATPPIIDPAQPGWDGTFRRIRVPILMYHYVGDLPADADKYRIDLTVSTATFQAHVGYLFDQGFTPISLYQMNQALLDGTPLPNKPVVLTFDDGYSDAYTNVFPTLKARGFTGTFFIITSRPDDHDPNYMSWDQIREMADAGMSMESHTKDHPNLSGRAYDYLVYQLLGSLQSLSAYTGRQPHMLAYPGGDYDQNLLDVARTMPIWRAVTTEHGRYVTTDNRLEVPRLRVSGSYGVPALAQILNSED